MTVSPGILVSDYTDRDHGVVIDPSVHQALQSEGYTILAAVTGEVDAFSFSADVISAFSFSADEFGEFSFSETEFSNVALEEGSVIANLEAPRTQEALIQSEKVQTNAAKVSRNELAVALLARLYQNRVLTFTQLGADCTWVEGAALAQLAGALLCDVDQTSVRITDYGVALVQELVGLANS